jgi:uncharacterized protein
MPNNIPQHIDLRWSMKIPTRDGCHLSASVYLPREATPAPAVVTISPYTVDRLHDRGMFFAARGFVYVGVDSRGRGNSEGVFRPFVHEGQDGHDIVEWVASQSFSNGRVGMYGGSYLGHAQWVAAGQCPAHLCTIVPTAAPFVGIDFPMRNNIFFPYLVRWLTLVDGRVYQEKLFSDERFWSALCWRHHDSGVSFREVDVALGLPSATAHEWLDHPETGPYWDALNPTDEGYRQMRLPILTITGAYDGDQPGAMEHYRRHMEHASPEMRARHYLVIGPWNHAGCGTPSSKFEGLNVGPAAIVDMLELHHAWYKWTLCGGEKPNFLKDQVAYYVTGAEYWRYAPTLEAISRRLDALYLCSRANPTDVFSSGQLTEYAGGGGGPDRYSYDPRNTQLAELESTLDAESFLTDSRMVHAAIGRSLIYHSPPFELDIEVSGFFKLVLWIAIDQQDTDFRARIYEIGVSGESLLLTTDSMRARYRMGLREQILVQTQEPIRYAFEHFTFVSRLIRKGSRLRLLIDSNCSIHEQRNFNGGGIVAEESLSDSRPVTVCLFHNAQYPSALYVPIGQDIAPGNDIEVCAFPMAQSQGMRR